MGLLLALLQFFSSELKNFFLAFFFFGLKVEQIIFFFLFLNLRVFIILIEGIPNFFLRVNK